MKLTQSPPLINRVLLAKPQPDVTITPVTTPAHLILNPTARNGGAGSVRAEVERELDRRGVPYTVHETSHAGHAADLAADAAQSGVAVVVAVGGDGTVHEVANGLLRAAAANGTRATALAVIPCGTGNDFARVIAGIATRKDAYDALAAGRTRLVDGGVVRWDGDAEYFVNGMGTGIDVEVVRQLRKNENLPAAVVYLRALFAALRTFRPVALRVSDGTHTFEGRIMMLAVCNGRRIGGAFRICPDGRADDGLLDACIVEALPWHAIPPTLLAVLRGTHRGRPRVRMLRGAEFTLESPDAMPLFVQLDGELREPAGIRAMTVTTLPGALSVVSGLAVEG